MTVFHMKMDKTTDILKHIRIRNRMQHIGAILMPGMNLMGHSSRSLHYQACVYCHSCGEVLAGIHALQGISSPVYLTSEFYTLYSNFGVDSDGSKSI